MPEVFTTPEAQRRANVAWKRANRKTLRGYLQALMYNSKLNGKKRGLEWNLDVDVLMDLWIEQQGKCALTGVQMTYGTPESGQASCWSNVSIDRIDSGAGYVVGNIQLVTQRVNRVKTDLSMDDLIVVCKQILDVAGEALDGNPGS